MDLRQLQTFIVVAEQGSLSRASRNLRVAQPALSRQIKLLEGDVGSALFVRHSRGMTLTETGVLLLERAKAVVRQIEQTRDDVRSAAGTVAGHLVLGLPPVIADLLLESLVEQFLERYPEVSLRLATGFSAHLSDWFSRGLLDVALLYETYREGETPPIGNLRPLFEERLYIVGPAAAAHSVTEPFLFEKLDERWLVLSGGQHGSREQITRIATEMGFALKVRIEAESLALQKKLIRRGIGETVLPLHAVSLEIAAGELSAAPLARPSLLRRLSLALPEDRPLSIAAERLASLLEQEIERNVVSGTISGRPLGDRVRFEN